MSTAEQLRTAPRPPGAVRQVRAVLALRATSLRGPAKRRATVALGSIPLIAVLALVGGGMLPAGGSENALLLLPSAWLGFLLTSAAGAATSGARALLPADQSAPFPFTPAADQLGAVLLAPLNVAWLAQAFALLALGGWSFGLGLAALPALLMTLGWIVTATVLAQCVGWLVDVIRTNRISLWLLRVVLAGVVGWIAGVTVSGRLGAVLDVVPTRHFVVAADLATHRLTRSYLSAGVELVAIAACGWLAAVGFAALLARRPARAQARAEGRSYPVRRDPDGDLDAALRIDRASVWRSTPLRRGLLALTAIPALTVAAAGLDWYLLAVLPGLVASGAGLLFGVNALSLDGSGALWRESLPGDPRLLLVARLVVVAEICLLSSATAAAVAAIRAPGSPTAAELIGVAAAVVTTSAQVVGRCADWSVNRPYAASLRHARDQPAPPTAMAGYSTRLAFSTTGAGLLFSLLAMAGLSAVIVAAAVAITSLNLRRTAGVVRRWQDPALRGRVIAVVAS